MYNSLSTIVKFFLKKTNNAENHSIKLQNQKLFLKQDVS